MTNTERKEALEAEYVLKLTSAEMAALGAHLVDYLQKANPKVRAGLDSMDLPDEFSGKDLEKMDEATANFVLQTLKIAELNGVMRKLDGLAEDLIKVMEADDSEDFDTIKKTVDNLIV